MIEARNLTYAYPSGVPALTDVSFQLEDGRRYALVGANGAGKSTLISLLCALEFAQSGAASVDGTPIDKAHAAEVHSKIGMVFQNPDDQLFMPTVRDDVAFGLKNRGLSRAEEAARVETILNEMGIAHLKDRPPYRLSGGEKRSVALATVLVMEPKTLFMDEPTAFLDPRARRAFLAQMKRLDVGMLVATHDLPFAQAFADEVLVLKEGRLLTRCAPERLSDEALLAEASLL
jgi:cobalt/nickel transport system ATP-binding protein